MLFPVFLYAITNTTHLNVFAAWLVFFVLHILVYPSSNAYNSYMDQDTTSIGGIENPPPVPKEIFIVSIVFDLVALALSSYFLGMIPTVLLLLYIAMSRLYSFRGVRLKKYGLISFLIIGFFQGTLVYLITLFAVDTTFYENGAGDILPLIIAFLLPAAGYPISQIYQHEADQKDGVSTISMKLGIVGTFIFSGILFAILIFSLIYSFSYREHYIYIWVLLVLLLPAILFFNFWFLKVLKNNKEANYKNTMCMNLLGAIGFNLFFAFVLIYQQL